MTLHDNDAVTTDNQSEQFIHVNSHDKLIGPVSRKEAHQKKTIIHRAVFVFPVFQNSLLFQQRSSTKDLYPLQWGVGAAGHVTYGQTYQEAAARELKEETGLKPDSLTYLGKWRFATEYESEYAAAYKATVISNSLSLNQEEVAGFQWVELSHLLDFLAHHKLAPMDLQVLIKTKFI